MIRALVVAASAADRAGLAAALRASGAIEVAGTSDLAGGAASAEDLRPDLVIVDTDDADSVTAIAAAAVLLLVGDAEAGRDAQRAGVHAVLLRNAPEETLIAAAQAAAAGLAVFDPALLAAPSGASAALTPREIEVLRAIAAGQPNKEIAWRLGISEHTVKFHVGSILGKLSAGSRSEAVAIGIRRGLVPL